MGEHKSTSYIERLENLLSLFSDGDFYGWTDLACEPDRIFWKGLQEAVDKTDSIESTKIYPLLQQCEKHLENREQFHKNIKDWFDTSKELAQKQNETQRQNKNRFLTEDNLDRLLLNSRLLISSAKVAFLARSVAKTKDCQSLLFQQMLALLGLFKANITANDYISFDFSAITFTQAQPEDLIEEAFEVLINLSGKQFPIAEAKYWSFYWLKKNKEKMVETQQQVPVLGYLLGKGHISYVLLELLKSSEPVSLENPHMCLIPIGTCLISGINNARKIAQGCTSSDYRSICWYFITPNDRHIQLGDSLSASVATGIANLYQNKVYYAKNRVVLGIVNPNTNNLAPVGYEYEKLLEFAKAQDSSGAVAALVKITDSNKDKRLNDFQVTELYKKGLQVVFISTLEEAVKFTSITPYQIHIYPHPNKPSWFFPRSEEIQEIKSKLLQDKRVVLHGMGGVGKTQLARELVLSEDPEIWQTFPDGVFWIQIGNNKDVNLGLKDLSDKELTALLLRQKEVIRCSNGDPNACDDLINGKNLLRRLLKDKNCLFVIDDVWHPNQYEPFLDLSQNHGLLITSRNASITVPSSVPYSVKVLTKDLSIQLLQDISKCKVNDVKDLPIEACEIIEWCDGLPYGLELCGLKLVNRQKHRWIDLLEALEDGESSYLEHENNQDCLDRIVEPKILYSDEHKNIYYQLVVFNPKSKIPKPLILQLIKSYSNDIVNKQLSLRTINTVLDKFVANSLLSEDEEMYKLHPLVNVYLRGLEDIKPKIRKMHENLLDFYWKEIKTDNWLGGPNDGYFFQNLAYHLKTIERERELCELLLNFDWLQKKLKYTNINSLEKDFLLAESSKKCPSVLADLLSVKEIVKKSKTILQDNPCQLATELIDNLSDSNSDQIKLLLKQAKASLMK